jgi:hypothetical protein
MVAAGDFVHLAGALYQERRDVPGMLAVSRRGVDHLLGLAARSDDRALARRLRESAKALAFNAGANAWPGWGDEGVTLTPDDLAAGLGFARTCLALVDELALGESQRGNALWLIGAHHIAARRPEEARAALDGAEAAFAAAGEEASALMARGYRAIAARLAPAAPWAEGEDLPAILAALAGAGSDDARFFADQLVTAARLLPPGGDGR